MNLKQAAAYFARTPIDGWDGATWVSAVSQGSLLPYDRFISPNSFGSVERHLMVSPDSPIPTTYKVVRLSGVVYLLGVINEDIRIEDKYSLVYLLRRATRQCSLLEMVEVVSASGLAGSLSESVVGTFYCDKELVTFSQSREYPGIRYGDEIVYLPLGTPVTTSHIIEIDQNRYDVQLVFDNLGFTYARCLANRAS